MTNEMSTHDQVVDTEELLRLAVLDMKQSRHEEAIGRLKRLLARDPDNARAFCLLGAEHAELGMFDRAAAELERAIELDPKMAVAHFQLGLIHYLRNDIQTATRCWERLAGLRESTALEAFSRSLLAAAADDVQSALAMIDKGLASAPTEALARDMSRIRVDLEAQLGAAAPATPAKEPGEARHALLSNYSALSIVPDDPERKH